jgi:hypothetical protein
MRVVGCRPRLALHREEIACIIPNALPTCNYNFDTHRSIEQSRVNCMEQWRWRSETLCGARLYMYWNISVILLSAAARSAIILASIS